MLTIPIIQVQNFAFCPCNPRFRRWTVKLVTCGLGRGLAGFDERRDLNPDTLLPDDEGSAIQFFRASLTLIFNYVTD
tara:strand:- start:126 stop:356 length:231 start_codon:yes stop_codon:yes gene_type:complete